MEFPTPSVGRQVWYYPAKPKNPNEPYEYPDIPWAATVIKVEGPEWEHSPFSVVNLLAINPDTGEQFFISGVQHSPGVATTRDRFAWMPYQIEQHNRLRNAEERAKELENRLFQQKSSWGGQHRDLLRQVDPAAASRPADQP